MNIAKIAIALDKSNRKDPLEQAAQKLNTAFIADKRLPAAIKQTRRQTIADVGKRTMPTVHTMTKSRTNFGKTLQDDDDSQDTIISQIVSKIREKVERTDSDDEMCLDGVSSTTTAIIAAKVPSVRPSADELSESVIQQDLSALVSDINQKLEHDDEADVDDDKGKAADSTKTDAEDTDNDVDHDDCESVNTSFSQSTSITSGGGVRKKRRKRSILSNRKPKRSKDRDFTTPDVSFYCDICNKSYRNQSGLNNHKATIMHISKLSQLEFLDAKEKGEQVTQSPDVAADDTKAKNVKLEHSAAEVVEKKVKIDAIDENTPVVKIIEPNHDSAITVAAATKNVATADRSPYMSPKHSIELNLSPDQNSRPNGTPKHTSTTANARLALSQEERLFYECCSMLKGSDRNLGVAELISKPVTPKSSEENSNIAHSAQSPRSHPSPRPGIPRIELNQFDDASSDSNPAYSCPQVPSSSKTQKVFSYESPAKPSSEHRTKDSRHTTTTRHHTNSDEAIRSSYPNSSTIVRNYPDSYSDMGDSFPSSQDAHDASEQYTQTILDRSNRMTDKHHKKSSGLPDSPHRRSRIDYETPLRQDTADFSSLANRYIRFIHLS